MDWQTCDLIESLEWEIPRLFKRKDILDHRPISPKQTLAKISTGLAGVIMLMIILACYFDTLPWPAPPTGSILALNGASFSPLIYISTQKKNDQKIPGRSF
jgi:hypothetical protein